MSEQEEWGPWVEHDGSANPVAAGNYCQCEFDASIQMLITLGMDEYWRYVSDRLAECWTTDDNEWDWDDYHVRINRYRIRKPRGLSILNAILREVERDGGKGYDIREMEEVA